MREIHIPYCRETLPLHVEEKNLSAVLTARMHEYDPGQPEAAIVQEALEHPIGTPRLRELAKGKKKVVLVTSDHTRAVPSKLTLPLLLAEIRAGQPDADITILIATGLHRPTTEEEQRRMFCDQIVDQEHIAVNNAFCEADFVDLGTLPSGAGFYVNRLAAECDLLVTEGFIEPHFFAGFSGGRKSILPGICAEKTVNENHSFKAISSPWAKTGVLEHNPIHEDMIAAARRVNVQFILNVALGEKKNVVAAFAGDLEEAHAAGVAFIREQSQCPVVKGDIVVTSNGGAPLDQNIYQSVKGLTAAEASAKEGAVLIMCAELADGTGGEGFYTSLRDCETPAAHFAQCVNTPQSQTIPDQWESQILARILMKHRVIFVSRPEMEQTLREMKLEYAPDLETAMAMAKRDKGENASVTLIPNGISVMVKS